MAGGGPPSGPAPPGRNQTAPTALRRGPESALCKPKGRCAGIERELTKRPTTSSGMARETRRLGKSHGASNSGSAGSCARCESAR
eukprot:8452395-Alexandrium_andersonii.AAC.1